MGLNFRFTKAQASRTASYPSQPRWRGAFITIVVASHFQQSTNTKPIASLQCNQQRQSRHHDNRPPPKTRIQVCTCVEQRSTSRIDIFAMSEIYPNVDLDSLHENLVYKPRLIKFKAERETFPFQLGRGEQVNAYAG